MEICILHPCLALAAAMTRMRTVATGPGPGDSDLRKPVLARLGKGVSQPTAPPRVQTGGVAYWQPGHDYRRRHRPSAHAPGRL